MVIKTRMTIDKLRKYVDDNKLKDSHEISIASRVSDSQLLEAVLKYLVFYNLFIYFSNKCRGVSSSG